MAANVDDKNNELDENDVNSEQPVITNNIERNNVCKNIYFRFLMLMLLQCFMF